MTVRLYPAVLHKEPDCDYNITFPDLPGCFSSGITVDQAIRMGQEAANIMVEELIRDGLVIPVATKIDDLEREQTEGAHTVTLVEITFSY